MQSHFVRRRIPVLPVFCLGVFALLFAVPAQAAGGTAVPKATAPKAAPSKAAPAEPKLLTFAGKLGDGWQVLARTAKLTYFPGEPIDVQFGIKNATKQSRPLGIATPDRIYRLTVTRTDGRRVGPTRTRRAQKLTPNGEVAMVDVAAGEEVPFYYQIDREFDLSEVGTYRVQASYSPPIVVGQPVSNLTFTSAPLLIKVVEAKSPVLMSKATGNALTLNASFPSKAPTSGAAVPLLLRFSNATKAKYTVDKDSSVKLTVVDAAGKPVGLTSYFAAMSGRVIVPSFTIGSGQSATVRVPLNRWADLTSEDNYKVKLEVTVKDAGGAITTLTSNEAEFGVEF